VNENCCTLIPALADEAAKGSIDFCLQLPFIRITDGLIEDLKVYLRLRDHDTPMEGGEDLNALDREKVFDLIFPQHNYPDNEDLESTPFNVWVVCIPPAKLKLNRLSQLDMLKGSLTTQFLISHLKESRTTRNYLIMDAGITTEDGMIAGVSDLNTLYKELYANLFQANLKKVPDTFCALVHKDTFKPYSISYQLSLRGSVAQAGEGAAVMNVAKARVIKVLKNTMVWKVYYPELFNTSTTNEEKKKLVQDIEEKCTNHIKSVRYLISGGGKTNVIIPGSTVDMVVTFSKLSALMFAWEHASKTDAEADHPMPIKNRTACFSGSTAIPYVDHAPAPRDRSNGSSESSGHDEGLVF